MRLRWGTWALALVASAVPATHAQAGTIVALNEKMDSPDPSFFYAGYTADPGEANRVTVTFDGLTGTYTLTDPAASRMVPHPQLNNGAADLCTFEPQRVVCHAAAGYDADLGLYLEDGDDAATLEAFNMTAGSWARVRGGDGDDTVVNRLAGGSLQGGDGADSLTGGPGYDSIDGGEGADRLVGGAGEDFLGGGGGDDTLDLRDMAADSWQCGSGNDLVRIDPFDVAAAAFPRECESVRPGL